jgi:hypothetical protein
LTVHVVLQYLSRALMRQIEGSLHLRGQHVASFWVYQTCRWSLLHSTPESCQTCQPECLAHVESEHTVPKTVPSSISMNNRPYTTTTRPRISIWLSHKPIVDIHEMVPQVANLTNFVHVGLAHFSFALLRYRRSRRN